MISALAGTVLVVDRDRAVIDVGGIGLEVFLVESHASTLVVGERALLHTVFTKRADDMHLSGFASRDELDLFEMLTATPGVGAKTARAALATLGHDGLVDAIRRGNEPTLRKVPGVGARAASMILVTMRPKLGALNASEDEDVDHATVSSRQGEAVVALQSLGWNKRDADRAVSEAVATSAPDGTVQSLIRAAMTTLSRR
ncbi:Holliday junction branch migration protein RuvA [Microbacterium sp. P02]|uniref:Holliday junction branch migration protein RuvA n=1 Tax=Microbacterium sp. P02 TaxID=3366260 RepID=UPI003672DAC5